MNCPICRKEVDLSNLHPLSLPPSFEGEYKAYHVGCANGEDCLSGSDLSNADLEDNRTWIKWT